jgi:SAM-dependent methyltransferase
MPLRLAWRGERSDVTKVVVRGGLIARHPTIGPGNHQVFMADGRLAPSRHEPRVPLAHYPVRSPWQAIVKYVRQWARVEAAGPATVAAGINCHCRPTFEILRDRPHDLLRSHWLQTFARSTTGLTRDPITYRGGPLRYTPPIDEPMRACRSLIGYLEALAREHGRLLEACPAASQLCSEWATSMDFIIGAAGDFPAGPPTGMQENRRETGDRSRDTTDGPRAIVTAVHPADEAMRHNLEYFGDAVVAEAAYLRQGAWGAEAARQVADAWFGGLDRVPRMLEYGPAFGCVTRQLVHAIPPDRLWCADPDAESLRFVADTFGVRTVAVAAGPAAIRCEERFDLIFVPTMFSRLPEERFEPLLERLLDLLAPGGVLVFATRDELWYPPQQMPAEGFVFVPGAARGRPGAMFVTEHFVRCCIERTCGLDWPYRRLPRGLCSHYDLYVVGKDAESLTIAPTIRRGPEGCLERCHATPFGLELQGWAGDPDPGRSAAVVEVLLDGEVVARSRPSLQRPDVAAVLREPAYATSGWVAAIPLPPALAGTPSLEAARFEVWVVADDGRERSLASGTVAAFLDRRIC